MSDRYKQMRQRFILLEIKKNKTIKINVLAKILCVTERTIRRDIHALAQTGLIRARYGGAVLLSQKEASPYQDNQLYLHTNMEINAFNFTTPAAKKNGRVFILGSFNTDLVYRLQHFPGAGETIRALYSCCLPGGKGSNQAVAACHAGAHTHFTAKVGEDDFALKAQQFLGSVGLEALTLFSQPDVPTGSAVVMVSEDAGDNAIVINPGANQTISRDEVLACYEAIGQCDVFLTQMENNPGATALALNFAHSCGLTTIFNPAPWRKEVLDLLAWATVVTPNLTEAESIIGAPVRSEADIRGAAEAIHRLGPQIVIITLGSKGCWLFDGQQHRSFPAFPAVNVDTAGAGDAFNGALAAQLARGENITAALTYASAFASLAVEREGASNMPEHSAVIERLNALMN
ncbi:ribokinase [Citrobacter amalonaticus]|uniref:Ribokinase n=1 Tax=Citrobacter amalonaticus TaxID=35703 RepID=A0A2S4RTH0_CITAM|nr:PfkB family carbohydrate kinase [Citrobacter amalonaticus]POT56786.1 ribokinase [Citrobacter amalonaticus]POT71969.1 ribokinase [Citrobacter amalonaticus]POU63108.1 ribokinase [Citrobacter amalonaticus]POV04678.1 ribokinase [Citrobacter amalonaticus]